MISKTHDSSGRRFDTGGYSPDFVARSNLPLGCEDQVAGLWLKRSIVASSTAISTSAGPLAPMLLPECDRYLWRWLTRRPGQPSQSGRAPAAACGPPSIADNGRMVVIILECPCRHILLPRCHCRFVVVAARPHVECCAEISQLARRAPSLALCPSARASTRPIVPACEALPRQATI